MPARARPLSPHLQIYRWQISNSLSILHRLTGVALSIGFAVFAYWLVAVAAGPASYARTMRVLGGAVGTVLLAGFGFAFFYHLLNGIRHLVWDAGHGFERRGRRGGGWAVLIGACALTVLALILAQGVRS